MNSLKNYNSVRKNHIWEFWCNIFVQRWIMTWYQAWLCNEKSELIRVFNLGLKMRKLSDMPRIKDLIENCILLGIFYFFYLLCNLWMIAGSNLKMTYGFILINVIGDTQLKSGMLYFFKKHIFLFSIKGANQMRLGVNKFGEFCFGLLWFRFVEKVFDG